jgi:hypothetical protein
VKRPYRVTIFFRPGKVGEGGHATESTRRRFASEEAAIKDAERHFASNSEKPRARALIKKYAGEVCWVTWDGHNTAVVRRDLESLPSGAGLWGYAS